MLQPALSECPSSLPRFVLIRLKWIAAVSSRNEKRVHSLISHLNHTKYLVIIVWLAPLFSLRFSSGKDDWLTSARLLVPTSRRLCKLSLWISCKVLTSLTRQLTFYLSHHKLKSLCFLRRVLRRSLWIIIIIVKLMNFICLKLLHCHFLGSERCRAKIKLKIPIFSYRLEILKERVILALWSYTEKIFTHNLKITEVLDLKEIGYILNYSLHIAR